MRTRPGALLTATVATATIVASVGIARLVTATSDDGPETERARGAAADVTTTTDPRTLRGFSHYRATVTVPSVAVHDGPDTSAAVRLELPDRTEGDIPQTFLVEEEARDSTGAVWYRVLLPVPPNGSTGWVRASDVLVEGLRHRLVVYLSDFRLEVYEDGGLLRTYPIGVGEDNTPTPGGEYYVNEAFVLTRDTSAYGSHALGLSGFSPVLTYWKGGGVIGIHGTNKPESVGSKASHGCIRMRNGDIAELFPLAPRGTPVAIVA